MRAAARVALLLGLVAGGSTGCAAPGSSSEGFRAAESPGAHEDAVRRYLAPEEVDVVARPLAPIDPTYPPRLRALAVEGEVEARVFVRADGSVRGAELLASSHEAFTAAVREALGRARFQPAQRAGRPVASWITLRLRFRLEH